VSTAPPSAAAPTTRWTAGRIIAIIFGSLALLLGLAGFAGGITGIVYDQTQRDADGYVMAGAENFSTTSYALVSDSYRAGTADDLVALRGILGNVRVRAESGERVFIGIGPAPAVDAYLGDVRHAVVDSFDSDSELDVVGGRKSPAQRPGAQTFWVVSSKGTGPQTVSWDPRSGSWRVVVMNASASAGVTADVDIGARVPNLIWFGVGFLVAGLLLLALGAFLIYIGVRRPAASPPPAVVT
jgi:hypothetical protein